MRIKLKNGIIRRFPLAVGRVLVARGMGVEVGIEGALEASVEAMLGSHVYAHRMMQAAPVESDPAPYGYKADGTPRKRPGRPARDEES